LGLAEIFEESLKFAAHPQQIKLNVEFENTVSSIVRSFITGKG